MVALLDVSVLVALFDPGHIHHEIAHDWLVDHRKQGWATCAITENGLVRILTSPTFTNPPHRPADIVPMLAKLRAASDHRYWPCAISLCDESVFDPAYIRGNKQVTDVYLLGLAVSAGGALATFDRSIHLAAVKGATRDHVQVISAVPEGSTSAGM